MSDVLTEALASRVFAGAPQDILILGCRVGKFAMQLSAAGHRVWACQESIPLSMHLQRVGAEQGSEVEFFAADPLHIQPFSDCFFDAVVIEEEVGCSLEVGALFEEACRVTGPGGIVAGTHLSPEKSPRRQIRCLDADELSRFLRCYTEITSVTTQIGEAGFTFWFHLPGGSQ